MSKRTERTSATVGRARAGSIGLAWSSPPATGAPDGEARSFSFDLDDDLAKVVTIQPVPGGLEIDVQYGRDHLLRHDRYALRMAQRPQISTTAMGVTIETTRPLLPVIGWPLLRLTYRF